MRSLAAIRGTVEPVPQDAFARFLPTWQHVTRPLEGLDGVAAVIEQLAGVPIPASAWESLILPSRVADYTPALLDELTSSGEVLWSGHGSLPGRDGWIALHPAESASLTMAELDDALEPAAGSLEAQLLASLGLGGAYFAGQLRQLTGAENEQSVIEALWSLTWSGRVTNDTFAPVRTLIGGGSQAHRTTRRTPRARLYRGAAVRTVAASVPPRPTAVGGRWSLLPTPEPDPTLRATAAASLLLDRYGVVTRGSVQSEGLPGGFAQAYRVLAGFEEAGHCRRGYVIEKLGAAQFAASTTVDRLRGFASVARPGAAHGRHPGRHGSREPVRRRARLARARGRRPSAGPQGRRTRRARRRRTRAVPRARRQVRARVRRRRAARRGGRARPRRDRTRRRLDTLTIEQVNGAFVYGTEVGRALRDAGFVESTRGLTLRRVTAGDELRAARA